MIADAANQASHEADVVLVKAPQIIYAELKREKKKPTAEQQAWIDALRACGQETHVWRPSDMDAILERLRSG